MATETKKEPKMILEREYVVPLRKKFINTPQYKRAAKAVKALKQFLAKHMKVENRDERKVKLDRYLNEEMWFRGIRKPLAKVKVKVRKFDDGIVRVELAEIPTIIQFRMDKDKKRFEKGKVDKKTEVKEEKKEEQTAEEKKIEVEKEKSVVEAGAKEAKQEHRAAKHEIMDKHGLKMPLARKALKK